MARPARPISEAAIREAARFLRMGRRSYRRAREPRHPSLRDIARHLRARKLLKEPIAPDVIRRALVRAGVDVPTHWRGAR